MLRPASSVLLCLGFLAVTATTHHLHGTLDGFEGPDWLFGYEIGHVARSVQLGEGFAYRIRGPHDPVPAVALSRDRDAFRRVPIHDAEQPGQAEAVPTTWASPAYTLLLAGILGVFDGPSRATALAALVANGVFQAAALLLVSALAFRLLGPLGGVLATALYFLEPSALVVTGHIWSQTLYHLGVAALLWLLFVPPRRAPDAAFGAVAAGLLLTDSSSAPIVAAAFAARLVWGARRGLRPALYAVAVLLALLAPWAIRNALAVGSPTPLKSTVGIVLHMGNSPGARQVHYYNGVRNAPFWNAREMLRYARLGEVAYERVVRAEALAYIAEDPGRFLRACRDRAVIFWLGRRGLEWVHGDLAAAGYRPLPPARPGERVHLAWRALLLALLPIGLGLGLRDPSTRPAFLLFTALVLGFPLVYYLTISIDRYRTPLDPVLCLAAAAALAPVASRVRRRVSGETRRRLVLAAGALVASLLLAEGALRLLRPAYQERFRMFAVQESERGRFTRYHERLGWVGLPHAEDEFTWTDARSRVRQNAHGFRGREVPLARRAGPGGEPRPRVVVLGDSFVWGFGVDEEDLFTARLEEAHPELEIVNLGVSGYGNDQMLLLWRVLGRRFQPEEVWVFVTVYTDFFDNLAARRYGYPKPLFRPGPGGVLELTGVPVPRRADWEEAERRGSLGRSWPTRVVAQSALLSLVVTGVESAGGRPVLEAWGLVPARDPGFDFERALYETPPGPRAREAWARMQALLEMLRDEVEAAGAQLRIAAVPAPDPVYPALWQDFLRRPQTVGHEPQPLEGVVLSPEAPTQRVLQMARDLGVPALDLLPPLRAAGREEPDLYFPVNRHWTEAGHEVVARALAPWASAATGGSPAPAGSPGPRP